jgi:hypothetical protein
MSPPEARMSGYLVVAHQTAGSAELIDRLTHLAQQDEHAAFTLVIPATPPGQLLVWEPGDADSIARKKAGEAEALFRSIGLKVVRTEIGSASPVEAIREELRAHPGAHERVILCTLPPGISHWLGLDMQLIAEQEIELPIEHVTGGSAYR